MKVIFPKAGRAEENNSFDNKRQRIPKGQSKIDNPETLATQGTHDEGDKQSKNTTQYVLDTNICKQTKIT